MKKIQTLSLLFSTAFILCAEHSQSQISFQTDYTHDSTSIIGYNVIATADGGFLLCSGADTNVYTPADWDACFIKTDAAGSMQWNTFIGGDFNQVGVDALELPSGDFIFTGMADKDSLYNRQMIVGKLNHSNGNIIWLKHYDVGETSYGNSIICTFDGNLMIGAQVGGDRSMLIKIDTSGDVLWCKKYGNTGEGQFLYRVIQTSDSGYAFSGLHFDTFSGNQEVWLVKTNSVGDTLWTRTAVFTYFNEGIQLRETPDHDLVVSGNTQDISGTTDIDIILLKYSSTGNLLWSKVYYTPFQEICYGISIAADSGYILGGVAIYPITGENNVFYIKTNASGDTLWTHLYDHASGIYGFNLTPNGNIVGTGLSQTGLNLIDVMPDGSNACTIFPTGFITIDSSITQTNIPTTVEPYSATADVLTALSFSYPIVEIPFCSTAGISQPTVNAPFRIFPNPSSGVFRFAAEEKITQWKIFNTTAQCVLRKNSGEEEIDITSLPAGVYVFEATTITGTALRQYIIRQE